MYWTIDKSIGTMARALAAAGGLALVAVTVLTTVSVGGDILSGIGLGPLAGEIELVEFGIGFAVFAALPYTQYARGHARVDLFARMFGRLGNALLDVVGDLVLLAMTGLIAWRLYLGMLDKGAYGETSFILRIPVVWGYYAAMASLAVGVIVSVFCVLRACRTLIGKEA